MKLKDTIQNLFATYFEGYEPPQWIKKFSFLPVHWKRTICYYDDKSDPETVVTLLRQREPVNIGMMRFYYEERLNDYFGYDQSPYDTESPNIAVYCYTPVNIKIKERVYFKSDIHVLNVIGVALDKPQQPDFIRIQQKGPAEYIRMVCLVFKKIKYCFLTKNFKTLVLHGFGLGDFSKYAKQLKIHPKKVFKIAFDEIFKDISHEWGKQIIFNQIDLEVDYPVIHKKQDIRSLIYELHRSLESVLFINAWDPFSIIGNGNAMDESLDGNFGTITAMSVLGWPLTNPDITYEKVGSVNIYYSKILDYKDPSFKKNPFQSIWHIDKFVQPTPSLLKKAIQDYRSPRSVAYRYDQVRDFLQAPFDISGLRYAPIDNEMMQWPLEMKKNPTAAWTIFTLTLYHFPKSSIQNPATYPYRIDKTGAIIPIPFLFHPLIYTDLEGIMLNAEWFQRQVDYLKKLNISDQKLVYDYSIGPSFVKDKDRLQKIIEESPRLASPMVVWRGISKNYLKSYMDKYNTDIYDNAARGNFQSTSIDSNIAYNTFMGKPCCLCQILLLPDTCCLFLGISGLSYEREILLPRNIRFKVIENTIDLKNAPMANKNKMIRMYTLPALGNSQK